MKSMQMGPPNATLPQDSVETYVCKICNKAYKTKSGLLKHEKTCIRIEKGESFLKNDRAQSRETTAVPDIEKILPLSQPLSMSYTNDLPTSTSHKKSDDEENIIIFEQKSVPELHQEESSTNVIQTQVTLKKTGRRNSKPSIPCSTKSKVQSPSKVTKRKNTIVSEESVEGITPIIETNEEDNSKIELGVLLLHQCHQKMMI